jgi:hypothetical protein
MPLQLDALREAGVDRVFRNQGVTGSTPPDRASITVSTTSAKVTSALSGSSIVLGATPNRYSRSSTS